uniref:Reverse transcriptase domain-containing protein n=1 Tax=Oryzias sinensis TaxID=183150 RepID=A0A8C7Z493_9TELE
MNYHDKKENHWISLFADDVLLLWSNISNSMQMILEMIKSFSEVSGHKKIKGQARCKIQCNLMQQHSLSIKEYKFDLI